MPKYIDADALKEIFAIECKDVCDDTDEFDTKWGASQELIEKVIDSAPAADVEGKRMTGVWLEQDETPNVTATKYTVALYAVMRTSKVQAQKFRIVGIVGLK